MSTSIVEGDLVVRGSLAATSMAVPDGTVSNSALPAGANIDPAKLGHYHQWRHQDEAATTAAAQTRGTRALRAGTFKRVLLGVETLMSAAGGDDRSVTIVVKKNGTSIGLTSNTITKATSAKYVECVVPATTYAAGDLLEVVITIGGSTGTQAAGLYWIVELDEAGV